MQPRQAHSAETRHLALSVDWGWKNMAVCGVDWSPHWRCLAVTFSQAFDVARPEWGQYNAQDLMNDPLATGAATARCMDDALTHAGNGDSPLWMMHASDVWKMYPVGHVIVEGSIGRAAPAAAVAALGSWARVRFPEAHLVSACRATVMAFFGMRKRGHEANKLESVRVVREVVRWHVDDEQTRVALERVDDHSADAILQGLWAFRACWSYSMFRAKQRPDVPLYLVHSGSHGVFDWRMLY